MNEFDKQQASIQRRALSSFEFKQSSGKKLSNEFEINIKGIRSANFDKNYSNNSKYSNTVMSFASKGSN